MEIRECMADDVVSLLQCAKNDENIYKLNMFDNWPEYQKWLLDAVYNKSYQVVVVKDGLEVIGFLVWDCFRVYYKWLSYLHYIFIDPNFRGTEASDKLILQFIHNVYNSSAQRLKFDTRVLPPQWIEVVSSNAPFDKYNTYYIERTEEAKRFYLETFKEQ